MPLFIKSSKKKSDDAFDMFEETEEDRKQKKLLKKQILEQYEYEYDNLIIINKPCELSILDDEENELILPKSEQIPTDYFKKGDTVRAVVLKVDMKNNNPVIIYTYDRSARNIKPSCR